VPHVVRHVVCHLALASLVVLVASGFVAPVAASAATVSVRITDRLSPVELTVPAGATIRFVNADDERHRMRSQSGPAEFDSHNLEPGQSYSMQLTATGTYTYLDERDDDNARYFGRIVVGGTQSVSAPATTTASVSMAGRAFSPGTVTIAAGGAVTFRNDDDRAHTVTADAGAFDSGTIAEGGSWKGTFKQAGTFSYLCAIHPEMTGKVVVKGTSGSGASAAAPAPAATPEPTPTPTPTPTPAPSAPPSSDPAVAAPLAAQPPSPAEPAPETAAVSTQASGFGGELLARVAIVGVLIGGAFLLFVRAVGGSVRRSEREPG
jgi:plastocyanin